MLLDSRLGGLRYLMTDRGAEEVSSYDRLREPKDYAGERCLAVCLQGLTMTGEVDGRLMPGKPGHT